LLSDVALSGWTPPQFAVFDACSMLFGGGLNWPIEVTLIAICLFVELSLCGANSGELPAVPSTAYIHHKARPHLSVKDCTLDRDAPMSVVPGPSGDAPKRSSVCRI
jgi:hypothetical protein